MTQLLNEYEQPVGIPMPGWKPRPRPERVTLEGRYCSLQPLDAARHAGSLWAAHETAEDDRLWTYLTAGPFNNTSEFHAYVHRNATSVDAIHFAVVDRATHQALGTLSLMRIDPANGVIEVGHVAFSGLMQRTPSATEAQFLLMRYVFDELKYRRYEWKCDHLNVTSQTAARRLGFQYEGLFRQAVVYKGRSRDTAWFAITDADWPTVGRAFDKWLSPENFRNGQQLRSLTQIRTE